MSTSLCPCLLSVSHWSKGVPRPPFTPSRTPAHVGVRWASRTQGPRRGVTRSGSQRRLEVTKRSPYEERDYLRPCGKVPVCRQEYGLDSLFLGFQESRCH